MKTENKKLYRSRDDRHFAGMCGGLAKYLNIDSRLLRWAFVLTAQKNHRVKTTWMVGILWLLLAVPFALVFYRYLVEGRSVWILLPLSLVLLYMIEKALLDLCSGLIFGRIEPCASQP